MVGFNKKAGSTLRFTDPEFLVKVVYVGGSRGAGLVVLRVIQRSNPARVTTGGFYCISTKVYIALRPGGLMSVGRVRLYVDEVLKRGREPYAVMRADVLEESSVLQGESLSYA